MIQYIYFVKCPNCEDEHFDFFDEAKAFALGCLSQKPIITQIEVDRNDFGECTDSNDLGMVWSWEDECKECGPDAEKAGSHILTKADLENVPGCDPEFDELDNSVEVEDDDFRAINDEELYEAFVGRLCSESDEIDMIEFTELCKEIGIETVADLERFAKDEADREGTLLDKLKSYRAELGDDFKIMTESFEGEEKLATNDKGDYIVKASSGKGYTVYNKSEVAIGGFNGNDDTVAIARFKKGDIVESCRKPVPEDMTIEQLVETMEENEDEVECTWCNELFPKSECRYEVDLGYLCSRCEAAIKSRGETLTFRENNYWDFLDEDANKDEQLTELFGFGKKDKVNRYTVKLSRDTSDRIATGDLWDDIYWMIKKIVPNVQKYRENRSFNTYFEFTATEKEFNKVEQEVKHLLRFLPSKYFIGRDTINSRGVENPDIKASAAQLINFNCVDRDVKESIKEYVDRDPFDHHDPEYSEEDAADAIADEIDNTWDSRYDDAIDDFFNEDFSDPVDFEDEESEEEPEESIFDNAESVEEVVDILVKDEEEAIAVYEEAADKIEELVSEEDIEETKEILDHIKEEEEEHIEELEALVDTEEIDEEETKGEELEEHVNEEHPAIESDQELEGTDNAVVDCRVADVITHSEDEKPVDCEGKKKPLEKPLVEALLVDCPECGAEKAFDQESGVCNNCGFII